MVEYFHSINQQFHSIIGFDDKRIVSIRCNIKETVSDKSDLFRFAGTKNVTTCRIKTEITADFSFEWNHTAKIRHCSIGGSIVTDFSTGDFSCDIGQINGQCRNSGIGAK